MDRSINDDDAEPFFHLTSSASSPALALPSTRRDLNNKKQQQQGFDFSADDVLSGYSFQAPSQKNRRADTAEQGPSRRHRSSGSSVYLAGELFSSRKDVEMDSYDRKIVSAVERTIKKYADNILRVLEGMNGRLSQLESVTQGLEHSVALLKASVDDYHGEADARSRALKDNIMEMHRAVQILRDKQDIIETHAELAKLQASKVEATGEKASASVPAAKQPVVFPQTGTQEQRYLAVLPNVVQERSFTQMQVPLQQSNEISGQLQQLSLSSDVNTNGSGQGHIQQPPQLSHVWPQSELRLSAQHQEMMLSMPGAFQTQPQHRLTQQSIQPQQGPQPLQVLGQQLPQAPSQTPKQTPVAMSQSEQVQFQVVQHLNIHQPLLQQPAVGQPSVQVPHMQFGSTTQMSPAQSMAQLQQVQPATSPQLQTHQISASQSTVGQVMVQPPHMPPHMYQIPNAHLPSQGMPAGQGPFPFPQQNEGLAQAPVQAPSAQAEYSVGPSHNLSNTGSSQQHHSSSHPFLSAHHGNPYQNTLPGPQPVHASQRSSSNTPSGTNARVAQNVYNQSVSGVPPSHNSRDDGIVEKVAAMGFSRDEARSVIRKLTDHGQYVDMNAVVDLLVNARNQSQRGWQAR